jgi:NADH:ubiquinone oxidoreductase subunit 6 (subunit J)
MFLGHYLLPFEAASVLLLVALIGAAMIVRRRKDA